MNASVITMLKSGSTIAGTASMPTFFTSDIVVCAPPEETKPAGVKSFEAAFGRLQISTQFVRICGMVAQSSSQFRQESQSEGGDAGE